jgi:mycothiol synthase
VQWLDTLTAGDARAVTEMIDAATAADGVAPVSEGVVLSLTGSSTARHLVCRVEERVAGYANLVPAHGRHSAMAEVAVHPNFRAQGIGTRLVGEALSAGGPGTRVWAHGDLAPAKRVAERLDLTAARELLQLRRSLVAPQLPELVIPPDVRLRTYAGEVDDAELLRVNNAAFDWHPEQGGWTAADLAARRAEPWFDALGLFVAADPDHEPGTRGSMLGFHWTKVHTETPEPIGEVYVVAIDPAAQGRGLGRLLTLAGMHHLRVLGLGEVLLYTEGDNRAALRTYDRLGFTRYAVDVAYASSGSS